MNGRAGSTPVAAAQVALGALFFSLVPLVVRFGAKNTDPFLFNAFNWLGHGLAFLFFVFLAARRAFGTDSQILASLRDAVGGDPQEPARVSIRKLMLLSVHPDGQRDSHGERGPRARRLDRWLALPMPWLIIASLNYAFFIWSTHFIEVAVASTIYELWPLAMVLTLIRYNDVGPPESRRTLSTQKRLLMIGAFVGLALVILGQSDASAAGLQEFLGSGLFGVILALVSAVLAGVYPAMSIVYGDALFREYLGNRNLAAEVPDGESAPADELGGDVPEATSSSSDVDKSQHLWFTAVGIALSSLAAVPVDLVLAFAGSTAGAAGRLPGVSAPELGVAVAMGFCLVGGGTLFVRLANLTSSDLGINAIFYITPVLALTWLAFAGITLPRLDLFLIGAALVLAINVIMQSSPDEAPEYAGTPAGTPSGSRLGFTSLVLALWAFGALVYLRDELFPEQWLVWSTSDYWSLLSLSATVFALIFGFRVVRLSTRVSAEDELVIRLIRRSQHLPVPEQRKEALLSELHLLDISSPKSLPDHYYEVRRELRSIQREPELEDASGPSPSRIDVVSLEEDLDRLVHSRQQGRDFSELIAISVFALVTVALGILGRPSDLVSDQAGWSGFLVELFTVLFVSVIAFLTFNLFDMRREREHAVLTAASPAGRDDQAAHEPAEDDFRVLFRYKRDIAVAQMISIVIVCSLVALFAALTYGKWL